MNKITPEVSKVLQSSKIEGDKLYLPEGQLDRKLYLAVNKHIENSGGKWDRKNKCHIFKDVTERLFQGINLGGTISEKKEFHYFPTPKEVAEQMIDLACLEEDDFVLEPSAGEGAIAEEILKIGVDKLDLIEINERFAKILKEKGFHYVLCGDFLNFKSSYFYDAVLMNPPFDRNTWQKHIIHAFSMLKNGARLVSVCPISAKTTANKTWKEFLRNIQHEFHDLPEKTFKESGTMVNTCIIKIIKK